MIVQSQLGARVPTMQLDVAIRRLVPGEQGLYRAMRLQALQRSPRLYGSTYAETAATTMLPLERCIAADDDENVVFGAFTRGELGGMCGLIRETREQTLIARARATRPSAARGPRSWSSRRSRMEGARASRARRTCTTCRSRDSSRRCRHIS